MLNITKKTENDVVTFALEGRLDTVTAPDLDKAVRESVVAADKLVLDLSALEYISSAGLRVLLSAQKLMTGKGGLKITGAGETIMEVFEVTGFTDILDIE